MDPMAVFGFAMLVFALTLFIGLPIAICIGFCTLTALVLSDISPAFLAQVSFSGLDSFTYLAIPLFILAGFLMESGGISKRIVHFAMSFVGKIDGGLGIVTVLACMFFAAISLFSPNGNWETSSIPRLKNLHLQRKKDSSAE